MLIRNHYFKPENKTDDSDFTKFPTLKPEIEIQGGTCALG